MIERPFSQVGAVGSLTWLRVRGTEALVDCYAEPETARLYNVVPIPSRLMPAPNDPQGVPNIESGKRGYWNRLFQWVYA